MKRFVLMAVAMIFIFALPALAQDQEKPIAPKKQVKVKTEGEIEKARPSGQENMNVDQPVQKKGIKPKKQKKATTEIETERAKPSVQDSYSDVVIPPAEKKGIKPKKQKKVKTETEIERKGKPEAPSNP
jgi:hypothetical protein